MRIPPLVLVGAAGLAQHLVGRRPTTGSALASAPLLLASTALWQSAVLVMRRRDTSLDPIDVEAASDLVTTGPFAISRNPIYAGLVGLLAGHAVLRRSAVALLPAAAVAVALDRWQIPREEEALGRAFADFPVYRRSVRRWI